MGGLILSSLIPHPSRFLATVFLLFPLATAVAQYRVETWTTDNGLPQNSVRSIIQTRDGYLWLTTFDGLVRFDGVRFTVFDKSNTKGLSSNRFVSLYEDKDGTLWIGTGDGGLTFYRDGVFKSLTVDDGVPPGQIMGFTRDLNGELLVMIEANRFYLRDGKFIAAPPEYQTGEIIPYLAPSGTQWTIAKNEVKQVSNGRMTQYAMRLNVGEVVAPYEDRQGNLWLGDRSGVYRLRDGRITHYRKQDGLPPRGVVRPQCEDDEGGLWFIGDGVGPVRFKEGRFTIVGKITPSGSPGFYCIFKDREGTIWVGSTAGLTRLRKQSITGYSTAAGLLNKEVYPILQSRNGDIWIGSVAGLSRFRDGKFKNFILHQPGWSNNVQALAEDNAGNLWLGTIGGLLRFENGKLKDLPGLRGTTVSVVFADHNGNVWAGGGSRGLFKFDGDRVVAHYTTKDGLPNDVVRVIFEDRNSDLWIAAAGALAQFKDGQFVTYRMTESVATNNIGAVYEDNDGTFWLGTYDDGLIRFRDGRFFTYKKENGLFDNGVFQILEDRRGYFWISCNRGIYRVSRQELNDFADGLVRRINSVDFGKNDGMLNIECNGARLPAGIKARDGRFWFPTQEGVAVVDPETVSINPQPPPVLIESILLEHNALDFRNGVTLQPGQRGLEISYTGLSYIKSDQVKFKYKLEGLDTDWIDAGTRRTAYFSYLPPGNYAFRVLAANSDGVWNEVGASVPVLVRAPFWAQLWFRLVCAVVFLGLVSLFVRTRLVQLERKQKEREAFARRLIESQEHERKRLAGELHDGLGQNLLVVKNWALVGLNTLEADNPAREHLTEISDTASQALNEVREIASNLRPYQLERLGLTNTIEHMIDHVKNSAEVQFVVELDNIDGLLSKDSEINVYRVVQECVNNVLKHSKASTAWLSIKQKGKGLQITCRDNGRGFNPTSSHRNGIGLTGMAERVRMLGGKYTLESALGKGVTVRIIVGAQEV
jgi:signal transduction histidine kinase/ligand-binding sensor domain-containing protein